MRKVVASVSLIMCLSATASAMDYRSDVQNSLHFQIGWEQKNLDAQNKGFANIQAQLKKLEEENEQLRSSINKLVAGAGGHKGEPAVDTRIQALVEENKRLTLLLKQNEKKQPPPPVRATSDDVYAGKIASLKNENQKLLEQINTLSKNKKKDNSADLKAYKEENALLKEALNQRDNGAERIVVLQQQIQELKEQNKALEVSQNQADQKVLSMKDSEVREKDAKIKALQATVNEVQAENRKLDVALAKANKKALDYSKRADEAKGAYKTNMKALETLQDRLAKTQAENKQLKTKISERTEVSSRSNEQVIALQEQNQSLRETIRAQGETLVSADNAAKTAERLLGENKALKRQLELADKSRSANGQAAKDILERNKKLQHGIVQRDNYIKKLEGLKETVRLLREENDRYAQGKTDGASTAGQLSELQNSNYELEQELIKERENILVYRTKIKEYQDEIVSLRSDDQSKALNKELQAVSGSLNSLRLENQELKARIELLSEKTKSVVFHKETSFRTVQPLDSSALLKSESETAHVEFTRGKKEIIASYADDKNNIAPEAGKDVTYIDTSYPPVDEVLPILGKDGKRIVDLEKTIETSSAEEVAIPSVEDMSDDPVMKKLIKPEELLAQELNPLGVTGSGND